MLRIRLNASILNMDAKWFLPYAKILDIPICVTAKLATERIGDKLDYPCISNLEKNDEKWRYNYVYFMLF